MNEKYVKGAPLPKSLGSCADLYAETRALRLAMQKHVDEVQEREAEIREHLILSISARDETGVAGRTHRAQIVTKIKPVVEKDGWPKLWSFIRENDRFDLLQKRLGEKAVQEMWDDGEVVPGVGKFRAKEVSITKI